MGHIGPIRPIETDFEEQNYFSFISRSRQQRNPTFGRRSCMRSLNVDRHPESTAFSLNEPPTISACSPSLTSSVHSAALPLMSYTPMEFRHLVLEPDGVSPSLSRLHADASASFPFP